MSRLPGGSGRDTQIAASVPEIEGAEIQFVEQRDDGRLVLVFGYRGTDDGNGYLVVDLADIHLAPGEVYDSSDD